MLARNVTISCFFVSCEAGTARAAIAGSREAATYARSADGRLQI